MKKDTTKQIFSFLTNDIIMLTGKINELVDKVAELEDHLAFYGSSINILETNVKKLSHDFYEEQKIEPYIVNVNQPNWLDRTIEDIDEMVLEKKIRESIIAKLEEEAEDNSCSCGDICNAFDNGFSTAISFIRNM
jgi:predicted nuclease with TOPRIM domain